MANDLNDAKIYIIYMYYLYIRTTTCIFLIDDHFTNEATNHSDLRESQSRRRMNRYI